MPRKNIAEVLNAPKGRPAGNILCIGTFGTVHSGPTLAQAAASAAASDDERRQGHRRTLAAA